MLKFGGLERKNLRSGAAEGLELKLGNVYLLILGLRCFDGNAQFLLFVLEVFVVVPGSESSPRVNVCLAWGQGRYYCYSPAVAGRRATKTTCDSLSFAPPRHTHPATLSCPLTAAWVVCTT